MLEHLRSHTVITTFQRSMTMQNASYTIQKFSENFPKIIKIKQFIELVKEQVFEIEIDFIQRIPGILTWNPNSNSFSGEYNLLVYPRITVNGKNFAPPKAVNIKVPENIESCELALLESIKRAINSSSQVWN